MGKNIKSEEFIEFELVGDFVESELEKEVSLGWKIEEEKYIPECGFYRRVGSWKVLVVWRNDVEKYKDRLKL